MYSSSLPSTSALDGDGWSTPCPGRFTPQERPGTHCIGGWAGHRADLDGYGKSCPLLGFDPWTVQPIVSHYTAWTILAPKQIRQGKILLLIKEQVSSSHVFQSPYVLMKNC